MLTSKITIFSNDNSTKELTIQNRRVSTRCFRVPSTSMSCVKSGTMRLKSWTIPVFLQERVSIFQNTVSLQKLGIKLSITRMSRIRNEMARIDNEMARIHNKMSRNKQLGPSNVQESIPNVQDYSYHLRSNLGQSRTGFFFVKYNFCNLLSVFKTS